MLDEKQNRLLMNQANTKQRFAIRKLTVGAASVLLGLTFVGINNNQVKAAEGDSNQAKTTEVIDKSSQTNDSQAEAASKATQEKVVDVTLPDNDAQKGLADKDKALVAGKNNTKQTTAPINGKGDNTKLTNVPDDGSIEYNTSISVQNKKNHQIEEITHGDVKQRNTAIINGDNAVNFEAHLELTNISDKDQFIGNSEWGHNTDPNKYNGDDVQLFINAWTSASHRSLKVDARKAAEVVFLDENGNVIKHNALEAHYCGRDKVWYNYNDFVKKFGKNALYMATKVGFKGIIPPKTTARLNVPLIIDTNATLTHNEIETYGYKNQPIDVETSTSVTKIWNKDDVADEVAHLVYRNADGSYTEINDPEVQAQVPTLGEILTNLVSNNALDPDSLYLGGNYKLDLSKVQAAIQKFGYSVNPDANDVQKPKAYYGYTTEPGLVVHHENGKTTNGGTSKGGKVDHYFYIEVHKILGTKDQTFQEGSEQAKNYQAGDQLETVNDVKSPKGVTTGVAFTDVASDKDKVKVQSIKDAEGKSIAKIDEATPAGIYFVTFAYKLNGSDDPAMLITKTAKVVITADPNKPQTPDEPNKPEKPEKPETPNKPEEPAKPTNPAKDDQPTVPADQDQPIAPSDNNDDNVSPKSEDTTVAPKPEATEEKSDSETVAPKAAKVTAPKAVKNAKRGNKAKPIANAGVKGAKDSSAITSVKKNDAEKAALPQTSEKDDSLAMVGLGLAAAAGMFGLAARKKEN